MDAKRIQVPTFPISTNPTIKYADISVRKFSPLRRFPLLSPLNFPEHVVSKLVENGWVADVNDKLEVLMFLKNGHAIYQVQGRLCVRQVESDVIKWSGHVENVTGFLSVALSI